MDESYLQPWSNASLERVMTVRMTFLLIRFANACSMSVTMEWSGWSLVW